MLKSLKKLIKILISVQICLCLPSWAVSAEETSKCEKPDICGEIIFDPTAEDIPITLEEALTIAMDKNYDIKIFIQRKLRDKWLTYLAASEFLPDVEGQFRIERLQGEFLISGRLPDALSEVPIRTAAFYTLELSLQKWFRLKEAYFNYRSSRQNLDFTKDQVLLEAARRYYELLRAKIDIDILRTNVRQIEEQFRINRQRVEAGAGTQFDVLRAEADRDNAIQQLLSAQNTYRFNQAQLANLLGIPVFIQLVPSEKDLFVREFFCDCMEQEQTCNIAMGCRNDLVAQKFNIKAARQRVNQAYSIYVPSVTIFGQVAQAGTTDVGFSGNTSIGLLVDWFALQNLGLRGYTEAKALKAQLNEEKLLYITRQRDIQENLIRTFSNVITNRKLIESTFLELDAASKSREISLIRLQEGIGSFIDVIQTQAQFTNSRIDNFDAIANYNISQVELLFEMGVISVENILYGFNSGTPEPNNKQKAAEYNKKIAEQLEEIKKDEKTKLEKDNKNQLK